MTLTTAEASPPDEETVPAASRDWIGHARPFLPIAAGVLLAVCVALRFFTTSPLWLDEALNVNISRLPLSDIPDALRRDGAPPLSYFLLHGWMRMFGTGDVAVRALSGVASVLTLPAVWVVARRLRHPAAAWPAAIVLAANPFAIHYATESRMYALVALEAALGMIAVLAALDRPTPGRLVVVAVAGAAMLYTHYWGLYLLAATGLLLLVRVARPPTSADRRPALLVIGGLVGAGVLWLPWLPTFLYQAEHTGTPWAGPAAPSTLVNVVSELSGGTANGPRALGLLVSVLVLLAVFGRSVDHRFVEFDIRGRPVGRALFALLLLTPTLALAAGLVSGTAFVGRYMSILLPVFAVLVGMGVATIPSRPARVGVLAAIGLLGVGIAFHAAQHDRTQAAVWAAYLEEEAQPGDVVGYCPDQLGPDGNRALGDELEQLTFPRLEGPELVNWVDYDEVSRQASPAAFAQALVDRAGPDRTVWLVTSSSYRTAERSCTQVQVRLKALRPAGRQLISAKPRTYSEPASLVGFPPAGAAPLADLPTDP